MRVAEGLGGLALVVGLGATLLSLWNTVRTELVAVDRVRVLRSELEAAAATSAMPERSDAEIVKRVTHTEGLLDELDAATEALPLSTRAVVLLEVREVRQTFEALLATTRVPATETEDPRVLHADIDRALTQLHDELVAARRSRVDRTTALTWALEATAVLLLATLAFLGHRLLAGYRQIEASNEVLEDRLRRRRREIRALRGDLDEALHTLRRTEDRLREAFAQATEAQRARAELEDQLASGPLRAVDPDPCAGVPRGAGASAVVPAVPPEASGSAIG